MGNQANRRKKINDALEILKSLGLPRQRQNERSALTLLALLDLKPGERWSKAASPLIGIKPIMDFIKDQYGKAYAPNTRETVRRQRWARSGAPPSGYSRAGSARRGSRR
jgi:adenine-specific DNA-methyltransferase